MKTTLIHNPSAGGAGLVSSADLEAALCGVGLEATHRPTSEEADLDKVLRQPGELVVVAGGDGTVRAVASRLAGSGVPLVIVPMGTANNFGTSLGLVGKPLELIAGLAQPSRRRVDVGRVHGPWGETVFLEGAGLGVFAAAMAAYGPEDGKSPMRALSAALRTLPGYSAPECRLILDGSERRGNFVLVEAMNTPAIGPRLRLAPEADPSDGWLEVVSVEEDGRVGLTSYLTGLLAGGLEALPNVTVSRARTLRLEWSGSPLHADADILVGPDASEPQWAEISLEPGALEVWLPALGDLPMVEELELSA